MATLPTPPAMDTPASLPSWLQQPRSLRQLAGGFGPTRLVPCHRTPGRLGAAQQCTLQTPLSTSCPRLLYLAQQPSAGCWVQLLSAEDELMQFS